MIKAQLSRYIDLVEAGETVVVCKRNIPIAEIRPIDKKRVRKPILGSAEGTGGILPSFHQPMTEEELASWKNVSGKDPLKEFAPVLRRPKDRRKK